MINKIDLALLVNADLNVMEKDAKEVRGDKPYVFVNCKEDKGIDVVTSHIMRDVLFDEPPKVQQLKR